MKIFFLIALAVVFIFVISRMEHRLTYYPRSYDSPVPSEVEVVEYSTDQGGQFAYFMRPANAEGPLERLWLLFGGNASLALDWHSFVKGYPDPNAGFLLIDYPGYGNCQGRASGAGILQSTQYALSAMSRHLGIPEEIIRDNLNLMGHSLGAAAALQFAPVKAVKRVVLVAPFTSLKDMARRVVGWPLNLFASSDYDNRARLNELLEKFPQTSVTILHGDCDEVVPVKMGRELAKLHTGHIVYTEIKNSYHNSILDMAEADIYHAMMGDVADGYGKTSED